jgi:hypothetical protein
MASKAERAAALAELALARRGGRRQTDGLESRLEERKVFDEVDDAQYREIVSKRRKQGQLVVGKGACCPFARAALPPKDAPPARFHRWTALTAQLPPPPPLQTRWATRTTARTASARARTTRGGRAAARARRAAVRRRPPPPPPPPRPPPRRRALRTRWLRATRCPTFLQRGAAARAAAPRRVRVWGAAPLLRARARARIVCGLILTPPPPHPLPLRPPPLLPPSPQPLAK